MEDSSARGEVESREGETLEKQNEVNELEAEEESAKAMDADVPQPSETPKPDAERTN